MSIPTTTDIRPVLVIGEALIDAVTDRDGRTRDHVGGSPANVALGLAALDHPTHLATDIGDDERGRAISSHCATGGVVLTEASICDHPTSVAHATLDETGAASYRFELDWQPSPPGDLSAYGHVHTGSIAATLLPGADTVQQVIEQSRDHATISYDPNARPSLMGDPDQARARIEQLIATADIVKASDEDLAWLYADTPVPDILRRWITLGALLVVVTRGADGAVVNTAGGELVSVPARTTEVVDTVGAGDSFMAGLISGLLDAGLAGGPDARAVLAQAELSQVRPAVERALRTAAVTVSHAGAYAPGRRELAD